MKKPRGGAGQGHRWNGHRGGSWSLGDLTAERKTPGGGGGQGIRRRGPGGGGCIQGYSGVFAVSRRAARIKKNPRRCRAGLHGLVQPKNQRCTLRFPAE